MKKSYIVWSTRTTAAKSIGHGTVTYGSGWTRVMRDVEIGRLEAQRHRSVRSEQLEAAIAAARQIVIVGGDVRS